MAQKSSFAPGAIIDGKYKVTRLLGEGAFGQVFEAQELNLDRRVALKTLHLDINVPNLVERFEREVALIKKIEHGNVVRLYDFGHTGDGQAYMSMEYVDGRELRDILDENGPLGVARATTITLQILDALSEAQRLGMVHRDLKPENILLTQKGMRQDVVKLLDFGIAKTIDPTGAGEDVNLTGTGVSCGTPLYMAPEQFQAKGIGPHTDLYAVGLIFLEMITGVSPITAESLFEIIAVHIQKGIQVPERVRNLGVGPVVERALKKEWQERYRSAAEMYVDLMSVASPETSHPGFNTSPNAMLEGGRVDTGPSHGTDILETALKVPSQDAPVVSAPEQAGEDVGGFFNVGGPKGKKKAPAGQKKRTPKKADAEGEDEWWKDAMHDAVVSTSTPQLVGSAPVEAGEVSAKAAASGPQRAQKPSTAATQIVPPPQPRSSRGLLAIVGLLLVACVGAGIAWFSLSPDKDTTNTTRPSPDATTASAETQPTDDPGYALRRDLLHTRTLSSALAWTHFLGEKPIIYDVELWADPARARVLLDGVEVCRTTPCTFPYNMSASGNLEITKNGYKSQHRTLSLFKSPLAEPLHVKLEKL